MAATTPARTRWSSYFRGAPRPAPTLSPASAGPTRRTTPPWPRRATPSASASRTRPSSALRSTGASRPSEAASQRCLTWSWPRFSSGLAWLASRVEGLTLDPRRLGLSTFLEHAFGHGELHAFFSQALAVVLAHPRGFLGIQDGAAALADAE